MKRSLMGTLVLALAVALAACSGSTSPTGSDAKSLASSDSTSDSNEDWVRVIGTLDYCPMCMMMQAPAIVPREARPWEPFSVTLNTIGTSSCIKDAGTEVMVWDSLARVVAYDSVPAPESGIGCATVITRVQHDATVRFDRAGEATVRIVGYVGLGAEKHLDSLDFTVMVGP